jgi:hypothetical protein
MILAEVWGRQSCRRAASPVPRTVQVGFIFCQAFQRSGSRTEFLMEPV